MDTILDHFEKESEQGAGLVVQLIFIILFSLINYILFALKISLLSDSTDWLLFGGILVLFLPFLNIGIGLLYIILQLILQLSVALFQKIPPKFISQFFGYLSTRLKMLPFFLLMQLLFTLLVFYS